MMIFVGTRMRAALAIIAVVLLIAGAWWAVAGREEVTVFGEPEQNELPPITLTERTVETWDGEELAFRIAEPYDLAVAAEGLGKARFMAMSPDGRLFVPDLVDYNLSHNGRLLVLGDWDEETRRFETKHTYLSGLRGPNSVAFYRDADGRDWLYLALTAHLVRYPYQAGDTEPPGPGEIVYEFPNRQSPGEVSVVWHITRTLRFVGDTLYIAIGSGCNSCEHLSGDLRGMVMAMDPDGSNPRMYADGLRNSVGLIWARDALYATGNGVDHLGTDKPDEVLHRLVPGAHYGWPFCYESGGVLHEDVTSRWDDPVPCAEVPRSLAAFEPRSAPLGLAYFEDAFPVLKDTFLVALHGSFEPEHRSGYEIVRVAPDGTQATFMDGFQKEDASRIARPVDILPLDEDSFLFTDDHGGRLFYVFARED
jgi:glucose/arabinose dehydrogenase